MPLYFFTEYKNTIYKKQNGWKNIPKIYKIFFIVLGGLLLINFAASFYKSKTAIIIQLAIQGIIFLSAIILAILENFLYTKTQLYKTKICKEKLKQLLSDDDYKFYTKEKILWLIEKYKEKLTEIKPKNNHTFLEKHITPIVLLFLVYLINKDLSIFFCYSFIYLCVVSLYFFIRYTIQTFISFGDPLIYKRLQEQLEYILLENFES